MIDAMQGAKSLSFPERAISVVVGGSRLYARCVNLPANELAALLAGISFARGLNIYATLATLGLLSHADLLPLPTPLHLLSNWWIIAASGTMFVVEFFADN